MGSSLGAMPPEVLTLIESATGAVADIQAMRETCLAMAAAATPLIGAAVVSSLALDAGLRRFPRSAVKTFKTFELNLDRAEDCCGVGDWHRFVRSLPAHLHPLRGVRTLRIRSTSGSARLADAVATSVALLFPDVSILEVLVGEERKELSSVLGGLHHLSGVASLEVGTTHIWLSPSASATLDASASKAVEAMPNLEQATFRCPIGRETVRRLADAECLHRVSLCGASLALLPRPPRRWRTVQVSADPRESHHDTTFPASLGQHVMQSSWFWRTTVLKAWSPILSRMADSSSDDGGHHHHHHPFSSVLYGSSPERPLLVRVDHPTPDSLSSSSPLAEAFGALERWVKTSASAGVLHVALLLTPSTARRAVAAVEELKKTGAGTGTGRVCFGTVYLRDDDEGGDMHNGRVAAARAALVGLEDLHTLVVDHPPPVPPEVWSAAVECPGLRTLCLRRLPTLDIGAHLGIMRLNQARPEVRICGSGAICTLVEALRVWVGGASLG